jgi:hypothetical protein
MENHYAAFDGKCPSCGHSFELPEVGDTRKRTINAGKYDRM